MGWPLLPEPNPFEKVGVALFAKFKNTLVPSAAVASRHFAALIDLLRSIAPPASRETASWRFRIGQVSWSQLALLAVVVAASILLLALRDWIISWLLTQALRKCTGPIRKHQVQTSFWGGRLYIKDVYIRPTVLDRLNLPVLTDKARIGSLSVEVRWRRCRVDVVAIRLENIELEMRPRVFPEHIPAAELDARLFKKKELLKLAYLDAIEAVLWKQDPPQEKRGFVNHLLWSAFPPVARALIARLDLSLERLSVSYKTNSSQGAFLDRNEARGPELCLSVDSFRVVEGTKLDEPSECRRLIKKDIRLRGVSLDVKNAFGVSVEGFTPRPSGRSAVSVLRRWSASAQIFCGFTAERQQVWHVSLSAGALIVSMDESVERALTSAVKTTTQFLKYKEFRGPRPQVSVSTDPMLWWKHAVTAVLREFKKLSVGPTVLPPRLEERRAMRRPYVELYSRIHGAGGLAKIKKGLREELAELQRLEARLGPEEIAQFRWWAAAKLRREEGRYFWFRKREDRSEALRLQMQEIDQILSGSRGILRRGKARYRVLKLELKCPKVSLLLSSGKDKDWGGEMSFLQIGGLAQRQEGEMLIEATCRATCLKDFQRSLRSVELLRSPAGSEAMDCVTIRIRKPSSKQEALGERLKCTVRFAPIDLVHEHGWLARLGRFFKRSVEAPRAESEKSRKQQPEHMTRQQAQYYQEQQSASGEIAATRYKASLADEVNDCAVKIKARRARGSRRMPHLDFTMGDVRMILPCHDNEGAFGDVTEEKEHAHAHEEKHRHSLVVIVSGLHAHSDEYLQDLSKVPKLEDLPASKKASSEDELWMRAHHDSLLAPLRFELSKASFRLEIFLARVGRGAHDDYQARVPLIRRIRLDLSHAICKQPVSKIATKLVRMSVDVSQVELILSPFAFGELAHLASVVRQSEAEAAYIMEGPLISQDSVSSETSERTTRGKGPLFMIQVNIPLFSADAVRFLDFDPAQKKGPYDVSETSLCWLSQDKTLFRAGIHSIDVRLETWPGKQALCISMGNLVIENVAEKERGDSTYRYFLPPLKQSFLRHFASSYKGPAFHRWRLYTKQSRNLNEHVPKTELERALRRAKAQMNVRIQRVGSLTDIDADIGFMPICCNLEGVHDFFQFVSHVLDAIRVASALHPAILVPATPRGANPSTPRAPQPLPRKASFERRVRQHSINLAQAESAIASVPSIGIEADDLRPLKSPMAREGLVLRRGMSRPFPRLPDPVADVEKRKRSKEVAETAPQKKAEESSSVASRSVHFEESDRGIDLTPQPVRMSSFPSDEEHQRGDHSRHEFDDLELADNLDGKEEQRTLQVRVKVTCVRLTVAIARETLASLVVQDVMCSLSKGESTDLVLHIDDLQLLDLKAASNRYRYVIRPSGQGEHCVCLELSSRAPSSDAPVQTRLWLDCHHLRATVLVRFIKDVLQCILKTKEIAKACQLWPRLWHKDPSSAPKAEPVQPTAPPAILITACDFYAEMPRHSWSEDMYIVHAKKVTAMLPTVANQDAAISLCSKAAECHLGSDWSEDPLWEKFETNSEARTTVAAHLTDAMVYWRRELPDGEVYERRVVASAEISAVIQTAPFRLRVKWPDAHVVFGDIQYSLLMAIIFENSREPSSFADANQVPSLVGLPQGRILQDPEQDLEAPPDVPAAWELLFELGKVNVVIEQTPPPIHQGFADPLTTVTLDSCTVVVSRFCPPQKTEFLQVVVKSVRLCITDERFKRFSPVDLVLMECPKRNFEGHVPQTSRAREEAPKEHFVYNYTIKGNGTHAMEITFHQDSHLWPYAAEFSFVQEIACVFSRYFLAPTCAIGPQDPRPDAWFYINVIFKDRESFIPVRGGPIEPFPSQETLDEIEEAKRSSEEPVREFLPDFGLWSDQADVVLRTIRTRGILIASEYLRVGYFWGGDGEKNVKVDVINGRGHVIDTDEVCAQTLFLGPSTIRVRSKVQCSKARENRQLLASTNVEILPETHFQKNNAFLLHLVYSHVPVLTDQAKLLHVRLTELKPQAEIIVPEVARAFQPSIVDVEVSVGNLQLALCDDRLGATAKVLAARLESLDLYFKREQLLEGREGTQLGHLKMNVAADYLNSAVEEMEAILESWPLVVDLKSQGGARQLAVSSPEHMSITITPVQLLSLGDALSYYRALQAKLQAMWAPTKPLQIAGRSSQRLHLTDSVRSLAGSDGSTALSAGQMSGRQMSSWREADVLEGKNLRVRTTRPRLSRSSTSGRRNYPVRAVAPVKEDSRTHLSRYRIINQTGLALFYWADEEGGEKHSHQVEPGEDQPLKVEPIEKVVTLRDSRKVRARTICVQLQGNWAPVNDVIVDKVGKSVMDLRAPYDEANVPLIFDVTLLERTKMLTIHSTLQLVNETNHPLQFWLHLPTVPSTSRERSIGPLRSGDTCYLPITAARGGQLYLQAEGYRKAEKDVVKLEAAHLLEQQGLLACPSLAATGVAFYCCLQVRPVEQTEIISDGLVKEFALLFRPPLVVENALPYEMVATIGDSDLGVDVQCRIPSGMMCDLYNMTLDHKLEMTLSVQGFRTEQKVVVHLPPNRMLEDHLGPRPFLHELPGLRLPREVSLQPTNGMRKLRLQIENRATRRARARRVVLFSQYWIINRTNLVLFVATRGQTKEPTVCSPQAEADDELRPVMYSCGGRDKSTISLPGTNWSKNIPIDSVGIIGAVPITTDLKKTKQQVAMRYELGVQINLAPSPWYHRTKIITITPRFVLMNKSGVDIQYMQVDTAMIRELPDGVREAYHWDNTDLPDRLQIRPLDGVWNWSGSFEIDKAGEFGIRVRNAGTGLYSIFVIDVSLNGASALITFELCDNSDQASQRIPYRIENRCARAMFKFTQKHVNAWQLLPCKTATPYAWDQPKLQNLLAVQVEGFNVVREYSLDDIKVRQPIVLKQPDRAGFLSVREEDWDDSEAEKVYVNVYADGATRVLSFSDVESQYSKETEEQERQLVVRKLKHLDERIHTVRRLLEQQKDEAEEALADVNVPLPISHQEPIDPTTGERPPLVQPSGTPPSGSLFSASPTASVELHQRKLDHRRSFLERAKRLSWGSGREAAHHTKHPPATITSQPESPELFYSPTGADREKQIITSPLVPTRSLGGHRRNQSVPPEVEKNQIERPTLAHARKSLSIESRMTEAVVSSAVIGANRELKNTEAETGHEFTAPSQTAISTNRKLVLGDADAIRVNSELRDPGPGLTSAKSESLPGFETTGQAVNRRVIDPNQGGMGSGYRHDPKDGLGHKQWVAMKKAKAAEQKSFGLFEELGSLLLESTGARQTVPAVSVDEQLSGKTELARAKSRDESAPVVSIRKQLIEKAEQARANTKEGVELVSMTPAATTGVAHLTGKKIEQIQLEGTLPTGAKSTERDGMTSLAPTSRDSDVIALSGTSIESEGVQEGLGGAQSGRGVFKRLRSKKARGQNGHVTGGDVAHATPLSIPADQSLTTIVAKSREAERADESQPHLKVSESGLVQIPLARSPDAQVLQALPYESVGMHTEASLGTGNERLVAAKTVPLVQVEGLFGKANGNGRMSNASGNSQEVFEFSDEQFESTGPSVNGVHSDGTLQSESESEGADIEETAIEPRQGTPQRKNDFPPHSVEGFHKFAKAAIAASVVSNAFASARGASTERFVQSAAGAAAAALLGGESTVQTAFANAAQSLQGLPFLRSPSVFREVEERPEIDQPVSGASSEEVYRDTLAHVHERKLSSVEEGEILGGDLVVRLVSAEGLQGRREHISPYCVVEVEKQRRRSATRHKTTQPQWNEELSFKAVRTTADLHVSVYSAERVGRDVFLGEVYIPLVSGDILDRDLEWFTLGRRNARDRVSGRIRLATSWTATQLELMTLNLTQKETELAQLEELVAINREIMDEREGGPKTLVIEPPFQPLKRKLRPKKSKLDPLKKEEIGQLSVKVVEARHLSVQLSAGMPRLQRSCDAYVVVGSQSVLPKRTAVVHDSFFPVWNETFVFDGVPFSATVTAQVYARKPIGQDQFLGEVNVPVSYLEDNLPRYLWLTLQKRTEKDRVSGDLRLRLQWRNDVITSAEEQGHVLEIDLAGVSVSVVDHVPREIARVTINGLRFAHRISAREQMHELKISSLQVDNQLLTTTQPVMLIKAQNARRDRDRTDPLPLLTLEWSLLGHHPGITYFKNFLFMLQEVDLHLEEDFVDALIAYVHALPLDDLHDPKYAKAALTLEPSFLLQDAYANSLLDPANWVTGKQGTKWYFERFCIRPMRVNVDFSVDPGWRESENASWQVRKYASALGFPLVSFTTAPLRLNSLVLDNVFLNSDRLIRAVSNHYLLQGLQEIHKILGSLDLLGSPVSLVHSLGTGVMDFFTEPAKATTPEEFFRGAAAGSISLVKNSAYGVFNFMSLLMGSVSKGLAVMSLDDDFVQRFSERPANTQEAFIQGAQGVSQGCYEGIGGLVTSPFMGAEEHGLIGCIEGTGHGLVGAVTKPLSGLFACMSKTAGGVGTGIRNIGDDVIRAPLVRARPPRNFGREEGVEKSSRDFQILATTLSLLDKGRYAGERIVDYLQIQEHKALLMTDQRVIFFDIRSHKSQSVVNYEDMVSVAGIEGRLEVAIAWTRVAFKMRIPHQLRLKCRTRDLHQSLLVKLNRHTIAFKRGLTFTLDHPLTGPQDEGDHRAETLERLSLFQLGRIHHGSTRDFSKKRSLRRMLTSSSRRQQALADVSEEGDKEPEEEPPGQIEAPEESNKVPGETSQEVRLLKRTSKQVTKVAKNERAESEEGGSREEAAPSRSSDSGREELLAVLRTVEELCHVAETDREATVATIALLLQEAVHVAASEPIRPILRSTLILCKKADEQEGPLAALENLVGVAIRKVASESGRMTLRNEIKGSATVQKGSNDANEVPQQEESEKKVSKMLQFKKRLSGDGKDLSGSEPEASKTESKRDGSEKGKEKLENA